MISRSSPPALWLPLTCLLGLGCDSGGDGSIGSGGTSGVGGVAGVGGTASGGAASGGASSGGNAATGGLTGSGGVGTGGTASGGSSSGGAASGGQGSGGEGAGGGSGGQGSGGGGGLPPAPSAGCSTPNGNPSIGNAIVGTPDGYDGSTPVPVIFAFHAAGNQNTQLQGIYGNTVVGENYLMIYLDATGNGWTMADDQSRFDTAYDEVMNEACVDENRVFATGHSSGAQFIVQLLCDGEDRFDAVAPVASSVYCQSWDPVPALVIHGVADTEREAFGLNDGNGEKDLQPYLTSNGCSDVSAASSIDTGTTCSASIHPGCVDFSGCGVPTTWCNHDDPQYLNGGQPTNHGVPCFAPAALHDFFQKL